MRPNRVHDRLACSVELLESRDLLAAQWAPAARLIAQDLAAANFPNLTGAGETVVIIDTGVDYKHPSLGGGFGAGYKVTAGWDFTNNDADPFPDTFAHGTGAAGVVAADGYTYKGLYNQGIAPGVNLIALRQNSSAQVKSAFEWVLDNRERYNIVAVNLTDYYGTNPSLYKAAMKKLIAAGVFVAHPSGNAGAYAGIAPQLDPADWSVGSVNWSGAISDFSQRGAELDLLAPGEKVTIPYYDLDARQHIYVDAADGTSWATPAVVGAAALIKQIDPRYTPAQIMSILQDSGVGTYDAVSKRTYKRLDLNAALTLAYARRPLIPHEADAAGPVEVVTAQAPFNGTPATIGEDTTIQAEDFDAGGEGVAYHDTDAANLGETTYRPGAGVDVESSLAAGGRHVGYVRAGEWLEYTVNVATTGTYTLTAQVASLGKGGVFHLEIDNTEVTGAIKISNTAGWQNWTTVGKSGIPLSAGQHVLRVQADATGALGYLGNLDALRFTRTAQSAFAPIAAANYSDASGAELTNNFLAYFEQGDWVAFDNVDFGAAGATQFTADVAALTNWGGRKVQLRLGSPTGAVIGTLSVTETGSWTTFQSQTISIKRTTGIQDLYLTFQGSGWIGNIKGIRFA